MPLVLDGTNGVGGVDGTASNPSYEGTDSNTGIFFPAADTVAIATGGTEALRVNSSQNVGIGTSSPQTRLHTFSSATTTTVSIQGSLSAGANTPTLDFTGNNGGYSFGARIQAIRDTSAGGYALAFGTTTNNAAEGSAPTERMRIDSSGNFSITQAPGGYTIDTSGGATVVANGGTVDFANASGMLVVNNHVNGAVTIYLCGGGNTGVVSSVVAQVGTLAYNAGIGGYRWTNNYGSAATFGFFFVRTRPTA